MSQTTLNDPLDGAEKKAIILQRISDALDRDCTLVNDIAHPGFRMEFTITLRYLRTVGTNETVVWGAAVIGENPSDFAGEVVAEVVSGAYETDSPNRAREAHDLGIPVMVSTPKGTERRKVKVARPIQQKPLAQSVSDAPPVEE